MSDKIVYRICSGEEWSLARTRGEFPGSDLDRRDGFIHLSSAGQVAATLACHYAGRSGLVLLEIDAEALGQSLRWEPSRGGALFPHCYGVLPVSAVRGCRDLPLCGNGRHAVPPLDGA